MAKNRLEGLRYEIDRLIVENQSENSRYRAIHLYGTSRLCVLLACKRGLNTEIAATCGMLHDIYQITAETTQNHALKGAEEAKTILKAMKSYNDEEINLIVDIITVHSDKSAVHEPYCELLKDADALDHFLHNPDTSKGSEWEVKRAKSTLAELGCETPL